MSILSLKLLLSTLYCEKCYANKIDLNLDQIRTFKITFSSELFIIRHILCKTEQKWVFLTFYMILIIYIYHNYIIIM